MATAKKKATGKTGGTPAAAPTVRVNVNVSEATRRRWKVAAASRDVTLGDLIEAAVADYLKGGKP